MIGLMWALLRLFVSREEERAAREHAHTAQAGHQHHAVGTEGLTWRERATSLEAWSDVAHNFRGDWKMLWKEITIGFLLAGFIALLGDDFFNGLFLTDAPAAVQTLWGAFIGPIIAVLSFVCSIGNVPLAAVLWSGGISFAGVMAFIFADLIVLPIVVAYRKYYGTAFALRITALMFVTMVLAALAIDLVFSGLGLIPDARPTTDDVFGSIEVDYKLALNAVATVVFVALIGLTVRGGAIDPVCGMSVDKGKALRLERDGQIYYFCSEHCRSAFASGDEQVHDGAHAHHHDHAAESSRM
jgi:YHS domain-containing protein